MIIIIGAGVAGLGIGWQLARRGHDILVLERDEAGAGASTAAAGMLAPTAEVKFQEGELLHLGLQSLKMWPRMVEELEGDSGVDLDYRTEGTLVVAIDRDDMEALDHIHEHHRQLGLTADRISGDEARELEPALSPSVHAAVVCADDHQVDPRRVIDAFVKGIEKHGGEVREGVEVRRVLSGGGRVRGVETADEDRIDADAVVVAAGAWSRQIEGLGEDRPHVRPVRGQMVAVCMGDPPLCTHVVRAPDAYMVPKSDGRLLIGSTMEEMGFDPSLTAGGVFEILRGAWETFPGIYDLPLLDLWTGFRPVTLDNEPILKETSTSGLWLATGHGRGGILLTPYTAYTMADAIA